MKNTYQATLFHPEGDSVTDFRERTTVEDVWAEINNMGSRWIFYPLAFVTTSKTVIDTPEGLEFLKNKRISTLRKFLKERWAVDAESICNGISEGAPLGFIYLVP